VVRYQVKIHDDSGNLIHVLREADITSINMTVAENEIGELVVSMPYRDYEWLDLLNSPDRILTLERDVGNGFAVECGPGAERGFMLRDAEIETDGSYNDTLRFYAYDGNYLLDSRIIAYTAEGSYTKKTDEADDMCILVVRENLGADATDTARRLARLTVAAGYGNGPSITESFARAGVLSTLQNIANESWERGTYLAFDTVYQHPGRFEFRVYNKQRGVNMGLTAIEKRVVRPWPCKLTWSRADERNYIYAGGQGKEEGRSIQTATKDAWVNASIWNRREAWANANNTDDDASILAAARMMLYYNRPRHILEGELQDVDGQRYGIDYHFGDIVVAQYKKWALDVHISAVTIDYNSGKETVKVAVRSEP